MFIARFSLQFVCKIFQIASYFLNFTLILRYQFYDTVNLTDVYNMKSIVEE